MYYFTGGLESNIDKKQIFKSNKYNYVFNEKFINMLRNSIIDWGSFLEIYHDNLTNDNMFDEVVKLLDIKENENIRTMLLPIVKKIYQLPAEAHLASMTKQFMLYEPISIAIYTLFTTIKLHFESIVERYITLRNIYIINNDLKIKQNDWKKLVEYFDELNTENDLQSSSVILLFLNPPKGIKKLIHLELPKNKSVDKLISEVNKFHYAGFCPKVPQERLIKLLQFPIREFILAIKSIDNNAKFPKYELINDEIFKILGDKQPLPKIVDNIKRETPPKLEELQLIKWYVTKILEIRKEMVPFGNQYEEYFIEQAKKLNLCNDKLQSMLKN